MDIHGVSDVLRGPETDIQPYDWMTADRRTIYYDGFKVCQVLQPANAEVGLQI